MRAADAAASGDGLRRYVRRVRSAGGALRQARDPRVDAHETQLREVRRTLDSLQAVVTRLDAADAGRTVDKPLPLRPAGAVAPEVERVITAVIDEHLSYVGRAALRTLARAVTDLEATGVPGVILETGCALGGSAIVLAAAKSPARPLRIYDTFEMIPPPGAEDGVDVHDRYETIVRGESTGLGGETYYGYRDDLLGEVTASFARHGRPVDEHAVTLVPGLFADTLAVDEPVALAHLDGDWYESTMTCLTRIVPHLSTGGRLVIDDYDAWSGCRTAVDEFFAARPGFRFERRGKLHIVKL